MGFLQKCALAAVSALVMVGLVIASTPPDVARGWTSTAGSVSAFLGSGQVSPTAVEVDSNGNIYTAGSINAATDFDPSPVATYTLTPASANYTGFVVKTNSDGELLWAGLFTGSGSSRVSDISVDSAGNVLAMGHFTGTIDLDPGAGTLSVQSSASGALSNFFAARLTTTGTLSWSHTLPVLSYGYSVDVDTSDNFVLTGEYAGTNVDFNPGAGSDTMSNGGNGLFVWSITSAGTHRWVKQATGTYTNSKAVAVDAAGNVYVCGTFQGSSSDFDPGAGSAIESSGGGQDFYLWSLNQSGNYRWVTTFGNSNGEACDGLDVSSAGNIVVSGSFYTAIDLGRNGSNEVTAVSGQDFFIAVFDSTGSNTWIYGRDSVGTWAMAISGSSVWFTGQLWGTVDLNPDAAVTNNVSSRGSGDVYLAEFDLTGTFQRAFGFGGSSGTETPAAIALSGGNVFVAGNFGSTPSNFNPTNGTAVNISATGSFSGFVNKLTSLGQVVVPPTTTTSTTSTTTTTTTTTVATTIAPSSSTSTSTTAASSGASSSMTTVASGSGGSGSRGSTSSTTVAGTNSTVSTTATTSTTIPTVAEEVPDITTVKRGQVGATRNGDPVIVELTGDNGSVVASVGDATITFSVAAADGSKRSVSPESFSDLEPGERLSISFAGFADSGVSRAWLAPDGYSLGVGELVGGAAIINGAIPDDAPEGDVRVVVSADSEEGDALVVALGVTVVEQFSETSWSWLLIVVVVLAVAGGLLVPAVRRRRQST